MIVNFMDNKIECARAIKGKDYIKCLDATNGCIAEFSGIMNFDIFSIEEGSWDLPELNQEDLAKIKLEQSNEAIIALMDIVSRLKEGI